jgi:hypothetical protein
MEIARSQKQVFTFRGKHYFSLYGACYAKAKLLTALKYLNIGVPENSDFTTLVKPEYQDLLVIPASSEEPHMFNVRKWQELKREMAKEIHMKEKYPTHAENE